MDSTYLSRFSRAILTGLFAGIIATLVCLVYNVLYRVNTGFSLSELINVSSLIFVINLWFVLLGFIYYWSLLAFKKGGNLLFIIALLLFTAFVATKSMQIHRSDDQVANIEFQHLLIALLVIMGLIGAFGIPYLFNSKKFEEHVL